MRAVGLQPRRASHDCTNPKHPAIRLPAPLAVFPSIANTRWDTSPLNITGQRNTKNVLTSGPGVA
ncbi:hypothetical protein GCM10007921_18360 [Tritonibacter mobilis]|nr:hypothetical protein GCM10007921_18360 [Tritonibacter mobilis]